MAKAPTIAIRRGTARDLEHVAELRWRLLMQDSELADPGARNHFVMDFQTIPIAPGLTHWLAFEGARAVGVMSLQAVSKVPSAAERHGYFGYLTNCYVLPSYRDTGLGARMLAEIKSWAAHERYELLIVFPSERSYAFYEKAGFARYSDPLTLKLQREDDDYRG